MRLRCRIISVALPLVDELSIIRYRIVKRSFSEYCFFLAVVISICHQSAVTNMDVAIGGVLGVL